LFDGIDNKSPDRSILILQPEEACKQINRWVAAATNNLIRSIVDEGSSAINKDTRLVVANAIYFKGAWERPFSKRATKEDKFHRLDGSAVDAQFMRSGRDQFIGVHVRRVQGAPDAVQDRRRQQAAPGHVVEGGDGGCSPSKGH